MIGTNKTLASGAFLRLYKAPMRLLLPAWSAFCDEIRNKTNIKINKDTLVKFVGILKKLSADDDANIPTIALRDIELSSDDMLSDDFLEIVKDLLLSVIGSERIINYIISMGENCRYNDKKIEWSLFDLDEDACRDMIRILYSIVQYNVNFFLPKGQALASTQKEPSFINSQK